MFEQKNKSDRKYNDRLSGKTKKNRNNEQLLINSYTRADICAP